MERETIRCKIRTQWLGGYVLYMSEWDYGVRDLIRALLFWMGLDDGSFRSMIESCVDKQAASMQRGLTLMMI